MSWYKTGTITITNGSKSVTGIETKWANPLIGVCSGQMLILKTKNSIEICEIASVQSDTQLTLANEYIGDTKTGVNYEIPTSPNVSIEALALRISEMLNYYQIQLDAWHTILTSENEVTLTAPDGRQVTIKSQYAISNEMAKLLEESKSYAEQTAKNADTAIDASSSAVNSAASAKNSADSASSSATASSNSAQKSSNSANSASLSESNAKTSELNAEKSAEDAKKAASSIDTSVFIKKSGVDNQLIDGSLDVKNLTENSQRVYSPNNKPTADDIGTIPAVQKQVNGSPIYVVGSHLVCSDWIGRWELMPFRRDELPFGWYFRNGDNYLLSSPQGQALNSLSTNYKNDHRITIKIINGLQYINVPTAFAPDGRGFFIRAVNGITRQVGHVEDDAIRNIRGGLVHVMQWRGSVPSGVFSLRPSNGGSGLNNRHASVVCNVNDSDYPERPIIFDASQSVPTANENRVLNVGATPAIYLGV